MPLTTPIPVLIADDHPIFRRGLRDIIAGDSSLLLVAEATDGDHAWALIQKLQPAVAVLDIHMPKRNGIQLARLLQQHNLPVGLIILTMDPEEGLLHEALDLGVKGYLLKETAVMDLLQAIHHVAEGNYYASSACSGALVRRGSAHAALLLQKSGLGTLTPTERQILKLIATDLTSKEISDLLKCSVRTVETHRQNISRKLELTGSHSLLRFAFDHRQELSL